MTTVVPTSFASKRTKQRIVENSPLEVLNDGFCPSLTDERCWLMSSKKTKWLGWIPQKEVIVTIEEKL